MSSADNPSSLQVGAVGAVGAVAEYPALAALQQQIAGLETAIKAANPQMDSLLQTIHRNLSADPELVHLLKAEERATIIAGLELKTKTQIISETVKSAGSGKNKGLQKIGLEDL